MRGWASNVDPQTAVWRCCARFSSQPCRTNRRIGRFGSGSTGPAFRTWNLHASYLTPCREIATLQRLVEQSKLIASSLQPLRNPTPACADPSRQSLGDVAVAPAAVSFQLPSPTRSFYFPPYKVASSRSHLASSDRFYFFSPSRTAPEPFALH